MRYKKVLIIAYFFPPRHTIGSVRSMGLAKYLPKFGWEPLILTPNLPGPAPKHVEVIETEYVDILAKLKGWFGFRREIGLSEQLGRIINKGGTDKPLFRSTRLGIKSIIAFPDPYIGWYKFAIQEGERLLAKKNIDAIISTSSPVTAHLIARKLKMATGKPWIADLRDLWSQNHYYKYGTLRNFVDRKLEIRTLTQADAIVTANPFINKLKELHKHKPIFCITNGFDPDEFTERLLSRINHNKLNITYTGQLRQDRRDPELLFKALSGLIADGEIKRTEIEIHFFGPFKNWLLGDVMKYNLHDVVKIHGQVSREESLRMQMESSLLLVMTNSLEVGIYPAKVFEYLGAQRPILAIGGPGGIIKELLEKTQAGVHVSDLVQLKKALIKYYKTYQMHSTIPYSADKDELQNYTHPVMAQKFAQVLDDIIVSGN
jgi:glycosyltransferase involved in cell wall biosynthesis